MSANPNLAQFYEEVKTKGVRLTNQWKMKFNFGDDPSGVLSSVNDRLEGESVTIWAEGSQIPGRTQNVVELPYQGYNMGIPSHAEMTTGIPLNFRGQRNMQYKHAFEDWMDTMSNLDFAATGGDGARVEPALGGSAVAGGGFKEVPNVDLEITLMMPNMVDELESYVLKGIFPTTIGEIELTNDASEIAAYNVDFRYQYWYRKEATS